MKTLSISIEKILEASKDQDSKKVLTKLFPEAFVGQNKVLVPFTNKDYALFMLKKLKGEFIGTIIGCTEHCALIRYDHPRSTQMIDFAELFDLYVFDDGSPCGKYE